MECFRYSLQGEPVAAQFTEALIPVPQSDHDPPERLMRYCHFVLVDEVGRCHQMSMTGCSRAISVAQTSTGALGKVGAVAELAVPGRSVLVEESFTARTSTS